MCRGELFAIIVIPMNRECLWRKTQIEKKRKNRKRFVKNVKKVEIVSEITCSRRTPHKFWGPNVQYIGSLTEPQREMTSLLGNTEILFELYTHVRANKVTKYFTTVNT